MSMAYAERIDIFKCICVRQTYLHSRIPLQIFCELQRRSVICFHFMGCFTTLSVWGLCLIKGRDVEGSGNGHKMTLIKAGVRTEHSLLHYTSRCFYRTFLENSLPIPTINQLNIKVKHMTYVAHVGIHQQVFTFQYHFCVSFTFISELELPCFPGWPGVTLTLHWLPRSPTSLWSALVTRTTCKVRMREVLSMSSESRSSLTDVKNYASVLTGAWKLT